MKALCDTVSLLRFLLIVFIIAFMPTYSLAGIDDDLINASINGDTSKVRNLLTKGAKVNAKDSDGVTALMWASEKGHTEVVKVLLAKGADVNIRESSAGMTALMVAAAGGYTAIVDALLAKAADVNAKDYNLGATPLMGAAEYGYTDVIKALITKGADVNAKSERGRTPLHSAAFWNSKEVAELLIVMYLQKMEMGRHH